ncbi:tyrosine-type recombinase/integrase [Nonomuraea dietziae]|uniref:tyrosine-type recombinase/integrase n=1 Tax=Nonomuraea dietziae TaxID=65515 RepID=UPI00341B07C2
MQLLGQGQEDLDVPQLHKPHAAHLCRVWGEVTATVGTPLDAADVRQAVRAVIAKTDLDPDNWTPRELRHSFVSLLSDQGIPLEEISRLVGHSSTAVTELVYRKQIRPVLQEGATAMERIFKT